MKKKESEVRHQKTSKDQIPPKKTKEKLIKNKQTFRDIIENLNEAYFSAALDGTIQEHNQAFNRILGFDIRKDLKGFHFHDFWENQQDYQNYMKNLMASDSTFLYPMKAKIRQGNSIILLICAHLVRDTRHRPQRIKGICLDITDQKKTEKNFAKSEAMYKLLASHMKDQIWLMDLNFNFTYTSPSVEKVSGFTPDEYIALPLEKHLTKESFKIVMEVFEEEMSKAFKNQLSPDYSRTLELEAFHKDGHVFPVETTVSFINDENGKPICVLGESRNITKRKQTEQSLKESEEKYRLLADNLTDVIFTIDMNFNYTYASPSVYNLVGYTADELTKMTVQDLVDSETLQWFAEMFAEEMDIEKKPDRDLKRSRVLEYQHVRKDGSKVWVENKLTFLRNHNKTAVGLVGVVRDITERKQAEKRLLFEGQRFRALADHSLDIIILMNTQGVVTYINPSVEKILGYKVDERIGRSGLENVHPDDVESALERFKILSTDTNSPVLQTEMRLRHKNGSWRIFETVGSNLVENNVVETIIIRQRDITARKEAEEKLRREEQLFRSVAEQSTDIIVIADPEGKITYQNPAIEKALGFKVGERYGHSGFDLVHPDDFKKVMHAYKTLFSDVKAPVQKGEVRFRHKNGSWRTFEIEGSNLVHDNVIEAAIINMHDITIRKKTEETLRQSEEKYRTILENMQEGYFEIDLAGNFTFVNDSTCRDLGYSKEELIGMNNRQYTDEENARKLFQVLNKVYKTGEPLKDFHWEVIKKDGKKRYTEGSISLKRDSSGKPIGFTGVAHDITERKLAEQAIRQSEEKYRLLADHMKDQVWIMDLSLKVSYVSPSVEKLLGFTFAELQVLPLEKLLTQESFSNAMDFFSREMPVALASSSDYVLNRSLELEFCCKDGKTVWGETMFSFIRDENGNPVSILGEGRNITERKQMEDALKKSEENFRRSLDDSPLGVRISTIEGKTIYANKTILDIYGYDSIEELQNTPLQKRYTPESFAEYQIRKQKRLNGETGPSEYEISIVRKDGEIRNLYVFRKEIFWSGQKQSQVIYQDITLRRKAEEKLNETLESLRQSIKVTIQVLGTASEAKDPYMAGHQRRVADLARAIAKEMKLPQDKIEAIRMASAIHDIGKISVPAEILCKPAILTDLEFSLVKNHPVYSYEIIKEVESPWPLADIVHQHHERIDGSGYPKGLKNGDILIESRILAVADVVEAMMSYRPYRPALGLDIALAEIENNAGILYDHDVVKACLMLFREKRYHIT